MLRCGTDLVTASALISAVRAINPDIVVLEEGTTGGRCELTPLGELGTGANGYVERCRLKMAGDNYAQLVAVKRFHSARRPNVQQVNHFLREASVLGSLAHPHIIRLLGIGTVDGTLQSLYTALELVDGPTLLDVMEKQVVAPGESAYTRRDALRWCTQLADALAYVHREHHLLHRDIKLRNLGLTSANLHAADIKLLDWGLACKEVHAPAEQPHDTTEGVAGLDAHRDRRPSPVSLRATGRAPAPPRRAVSSRAVYRQPSSPQAPGSARTSTRAHSRDQRTQLQKRSTFSTRQDVRPVCASRRGTQPLFSSHVDEAVSMNTGSTGTPIYSSPEARISTIMNDKSDMYSFGMVTYEMFNGTTVLYQAALAGHTAGTGATAMVSGDWSPSFRRDCPQGIIDLVHACWSRDPAGRPTAAEALERLRALETTADAKDRGKLAEAERHSGPTPQAPKGGGDAVRPRRRRLPGCLPCLGVSADEPT